MPDVQPITVADQSFWGNTGYGLSARPSISADGQRIVFQSDAPNLVPNDSNGTTDVFLYDRGTGRTSLVSINAAGTLSGNGPSIDPHITPDGRYVVFRSSATDLVSAQTVSGFADVYVRDLVAGTTRLASVNSSGTGGAGQNCADISITPDGRYVLFDTPANNLAPSDTNNAVDVFRRDLQTNTTQLVSVSMTGGPGNSDSSQPEMTPDGRFVLFRSTASNLATFNQNNISDALFVRDMQTGTTRLASTDATGVNNANAHTSESGQAISADGRYVVFWTGATNLVSQPVFFPNVILHDMQTNANRLVTFNRAGTAGASGFSAVITPDGQHIAYVSATDDLASDVTDTNGRPDVFLATITPTAFTTRMVSVNGAGTNGGDNDSGTTVYNNDLTFGYPQVSADGRYVAFESLASNLVAGVTDANNDRDIFVRDMQTNTTRLVSVTPAGAAGALRSTSPAMNGDGTVVAFESLAANLVPNDVNGTQDIFVRDLSAGVTEVATRRSPLMPPQLIISTENTSLMDATPDGRYVAFLNRTQTDLLPPITPSGSDNLFLRDRQTGAVELVSVQPNGQPTPRPVGASRISADARYVALTTDATNLDAAVNAPNGGIYLRDRLTGVTKYISRNPTTGAAADAINTSLQAISPDGRYVAFISRATNLVSGVTTNGNDQLFVYDRLTGSLAMLTANAAGTAVGNGSYTGQAVFSGDSSKLIFTSTSSDLIAGVTDTNNAADVFAYDLASRTLSLVSVSTTPNTAGNFVSGVGQYQPRISANGRYVVFGSDATNLVAGVGGGQVYLRDLLAGTTTVVSVNSTGTPGNQISAAPDISADGRYVLFTTTASNLTPLNTSNLLQLYLRDRTTNTTQLVTVSGNGTAGGNINTADARLSADGQFVVFRSPASNLVANFVPSDPSGFNNNLYIRDLARGATVLITENKSGTAAAAANEDGNFIVGRTSAGTTTAVFATSAGDLVPYDYNQRPDVYTFDYHGAGSISGTVFNDADGNGTQGAGEAGIPFWTVYIDANANGRFDPGERYVQTDLNGHYTFSNLPAGTYTVAAVVDDGFVRTTAAGRTVTLATDTSAATGADFGARVVPVDLVLGTVTAPATAAPGENAVVSWLVRNVGSTAISGSWQDAVYISSNPQFDTSAILLANVPHTGGLGSKASYTDTATVTLPALPAGNYYFFVDVDRRHQVAGDTNHTNNLLAAATPTALVIPTLTPGTATASSFSAAAQNRYFQVTVAPGQTLTVTLHSAASAGTTELYVSQLQLPTPGNFDFSARAIQQDQTLSIPNTQPVTYYILARAGSGAASLASFTITAAVPTFSLTAVGPNRGGNTGRVTVQVRGSRFTPATQVQLVSGTTTISAAAVSVNDATTLYATFDLTGQSLGTYDVRASDGAASTSLAGAFSVVAGRANPIQLTLTVPAKVRQLRTGVAIVQYTNTGNMDVTAPLLQLVAPNAQLRLTEQSSFGGASLQFLGIAPDGPAGILRPGQSGQVQIVFQAPPTATASQINFTLNIVTDPTAVMDWNAAKTGLRPVSTPTDAWDAIYANFVATVGSTVGQYQAVLADDATYLSQLGIRTADVGRLLVFELRQAGVTFPGQDLATDTDAAVSAPGFDLTLVRTYAPSIDTRYRIGGFGRGWTFNWEIAATTDAAGNVAIKDGAQFRYFIKQPDGTYAGVPGEPATLTLTNGAFRLRETNGTVTQFRTDGRFDYIQDRNGNRVTASYDASGRLLSLAHSAGPTLTLAYNTQSSISSVTDSTGRTETYGYDASGQHLTTYTDRFGTTTYSYVTGQGAASENALAQIAYPDNTHVFFAYDTQGRLIEQKHDNDQERVTFAYDSAAGVTVTPAAGGQITVLYNDVGEAALVRDALGRTVQYQYDTNFHLSRLVTPSGLTYTYVADNFGGFLSETNPLGQTVRFTYDGTFHNLTSLTDASGNATSYGYDAAGNLRTITYPNANKEQFSYDPLGDLTETINRRGDAVNYTYDSRGRLARETFADGTHVDFAYDAHDNLNTATDSSGTTTFTYNASDFLTRIDYPNGRFLAFTVNVVGQRTQSVDQDGFTVNYVYDAIGRLSELRDGGNALIVHYTYDAEGRLVRKDNGNSTFTTYAYDADNRLTSLVNSAPGGTVNSRFDYAYDADSNLISETTTGGTTTYGYDALGQLTSLTLPGGRTITYAYDTNGNRVRATDSGATTVNSVDNLNEITAVGTTSYAYDADGNLIRQDSGTGVTTYTWNDLNQLTSVTRSNGTFQYEYDAFGDRRATVQNGVRTDYLIDPTQLNDVVGEYGPGGTVAKYVSASGLGLVSRISGGAAAYYDFELNGSTAGVTNAGGSYVNRYSYLPFGETTTLAATLPNPFTFVGQFGVSGDGSGLFSMRFRNYSATLSQFLSDDPIGLSGGDADLRRYVGNNPVRLIDPFGLQSQDGAVNDAQNTAIANATAVKNTPGLAKPFAAVLNGIGGIAQVLGIVGKSAGATGSSQDTSSVDPNDLIGPTGFGAPQFVAPAQPLAYTIDFENQATATAPAEEVFVTQPLDANLDWSTFALGDFGFGATTVHVPAGLQNYQTSIYTTNPDGSPLQVNVSIGLNLQTGLVTWTLSSIDPKTSLFPENPLAGFLPPNDATGRGDGFVTYTVRPKAGLATGITINEQASIVFDLNAPVATNVFTNTIDGAAPTSSVQSLPATTTTASFLVSWSGQDDAGGSGIASFNVYVSDNGGPFALWQSATAATSAVYSGQNGHTYVFYSVATDNVGLMQPTPAGAQATTTVNARPPLVQGVAVNGGAAQRSMLTSITVTFNQVVALAAGAFVLSPDAGGPAISLNQAVQIVNGRTVVTLTFAGTGIIGGSLADGRYTLTIVSVNVHDSLGVALDGDGDGQAGGDSVSHLFRLFGDVNGDGVVNGLDLALFRSAFGTSFGNPNFVDYLDQNGDGAVNGLDLAAFRARFGTTLP
jgi:RHS repeat-associated protein